MSTMETFCVNLWVKLCRLIGTEEQVLIRRQRYELFAKCMNVIYSGRPIYSGSKAEGLNLAGSDDDIMTICDDFHITMSNTLVDHENNFFTERDNIKPGFVRIRYRGNIRNIGDHDIISQTNDGFFLSYLFAREKVVDAWRKVCPGAVCHGPCAALNVDGSEMDLLECFPCSTWPALEWRYRTRNHGWPSEVLIQKIIDEGCLLVPIGNPNSSNPSIEWRISFSLAEKRLVHSFNHTQLLCYGLLKLYLKHVLNLNAEVKNLLCSDFLKTSLFYCIEEENISWCKENIFDCFWTCFRRLLKWVQQGYCPNYFIKENNMIEGKICESNQRIVLRYLSELYVEKHESLQKVPCLSANVFDNFQREIPMVIESKEKEFLCDIQLGSIMCQLTYGFKNETIKLLQNIEKFKVEATMKTDIAILQIFQNDSTSILIQQLYKDTVGIVPNKTRYKRVKGLKHYIKQNCTNVDKCTCMLLLAILFYLNGEYKDVVLIVENVLKLYGRFMTMLYNPKTYMDKICGKGYTLQQKFDMGLFSSMLTFKCDCGFYPQEMESEFLNLSANEYRNIPTEVFSYVLLILSYYNLKQTQKMKFALNELYLAVRSLHLDDYRRSIAISLLHRCLEVAKSHQANTSMPTMLLF